jgi:hypothetical protein
MTAERRGLPVPPNKASRLTAYPTQQSTISADLRLGTTYQIA